MDIRELLKDKRDDLLRIAARRRAQNVRVFGSVAKGRAGPKSDVDFLVEMEPGRNLLDHVALCRTLRSYSVAR